MVQTHKVVRLQQRPVGLPKPNEDLVVFTEAKPTPEQVESGQLLLKTLFLSLDPAMRGWMSSAKSYVPPVEIGSIMRGNTVSQVVHSNCEGFKVGDIVNDKGLNNHGWAQYQIVSGNQVGVLHRDGLDVPYSAFLGALGGTGLTAYFGLLAVGQPKPGETVVISAAAGATGSVAAQIAKHVIGCRVVGIAGGKEKCDWLVNTLGLDAAIDYKSVANPGEFGKQMRKACPQGVDVFFDNVGGWILDQTLRHLNFKARVALCGAISTYNVTELPPGPANINSLIVNSAKMEGFIVMNYAEHFGKGRNDLVKWHNEGKIKFNEAIVEGIEQAPTALLQLFQGHNFGKLIVHVGDPETTANSKL